MNIRNWLIGWFLLFAIVNINAQENNQNKSLIQFSGVVLTADSLNPVPFTNILVMNSTNSKYVKGTAANYLGFFSFVANKNDTICFSAIGYKPVTFIIPDTINDNKYSLIQLMHSDTLLLAETVIYPWPSKEDFKKMFLELDIPDDNITIAEKNLQMANLKAAAKMGSPNAIANYRNYINNKTNQLYAMGQIPPNNYLNPIAWLKFIKAWKNGAFKTDKKIKEAIKEQEKIDRKRWDYDEWIEKS